MMSRIILRNAYVLLRGTYPVNLDLLNLNIAVWVNSATIPNSK